MRVLLMIDSLSGGGAERSTLDYCLYLMHMNHTVRIMFLRRAHPGFHEEAEQKGVDVKFFKKKALLSQVAEMDECYKEYRPDIVHSTLYKSRLRARLHKLFYFRGYRLIESLVTMSYTDEKIKQRGKRYFIELLHKVLESFLARLTVTKFIAISQEVKTHYIDQHFGINKESISVIYRGRTLNPYLNRKETLRKFYASELLFDEDAIVFIHIGRQDFPKNHLLLLSTFFKLVRENRSSKLILLCVGKTGDMSKKIQNYIRQYPTQSGVYFLGHRTDVPQLLVQSDIFIFPSLFEGLGGSIIEAKAASLPIIASDLPVFRELLTENTEALFADLNDVEDFVAKMFLLVDDPIKRNSMGIENLESFKKKFMIDMVNAEMLDLYKSVL